MIPKEKVKEGSKLVMVGKAPKKQLPLPPSQYHHHHHALASSPSSMSVSLASSSPFSPPPSASGNSQAGASSSSSSATAFSSPSQTPSSFTWAATLRELLINVAGQRNQIVALVNSIDPGFLTSAHPKFAQEHKLLNQVVELQGRILDVREELKYMRSKNAQLEQQLTSFHVGRKGAA